MSTFNTGIQSDLSAARLGKPGGFAPLDENNKVPDEFLPTVSEATSIASEVTFDNTNSNLISTNVQDAVDEVKSLIKSTAGEISFGAVDGNLTETDTNVQQAIGTLDGAVRTLQTQVIGGVTYKGGYRADLNSPILESVFTPGSGPVAVSGDGVTVTGTGTSFTSEASVGDLIEIFGTRAFIDTIVDDTTLTVDPPFGFPIRASSGSTYVIKDPIINVEIGDMYTVTADGDFYGTAVTVGDVIIAEGNNPYVGANWTIVETNIEDAADIAYNNGTSGLTATNVQTSIDELQTVKLDNKYLKISSALPGAIASGNGAISIGPESKVNANGGIAIGSKASSTFQLAVAIGPSALASSADAVALGSFSLCSSSSSIALGTRAKATSTNSTSLGAFASATRSGALALGISTEASSTASVAIGSSATASASESIQLGNGTNSSFATLQFKNNRIANAEGLYTSHTAVNYTPADADNVTSHFEAIDTALGNTYTPLQPFTVNEETITANKSLETGDEVFQHIISDTASLEVGLPSSPVNGTRFIIKNDESSIESFDVTNGPATATLAPGQIYEAVYGDTKWMVI